MTFYNPYNPYGYEPEMPGPIDDDTTMTDEERMRARMHRVIVQLISIVVALIIGIGLCALFDSCTTERVVTVERHTTDTLRISQYQRDSIYLSDSIYVSDFVRDDTVFKTVERWHTQYRDRWRTDTVYQSKTDTVPVPVPVPAGKPQNTLTWWQQARLYLANIMLWMALLIGVIYVGKKFTK